MQRAKCYQTVVRLGTYTGKFPVYNSLKACEGTMFFLPLPFNKTTRLWNGWRTVAALYPIQSCTSVNGKPTKGNVVWRSLVNVDLVKVATTAQTKINWLYKDVDADSFDEASKKVIKVANNASSTMLEKASTADVDSFQAYTIRNLDKLRPGAVQTAQRQGGSLGQPTAAP